MQPAGDRRRGGRARPAADQQDLRHRRRRGARREADHVGRAERVARDGLEDRAGDAERGAGEQAVDGARQPQRLDDERRLPGRRRRAASPRRRAGRPGTRRCRGRGPPAPAAAAASAAIVASTRGAGRITAAPPAGRRTRAMNSGPPRNAQTTPTWISPGGSITRPITSAPSSSVGATTTANGSTQRWSGPVIARTMCGTARPMNAIGPAAAVAAPHSRVIATKPTARARSTFAPSARPASSPSAIALSARGSTSPSSEARGDERRDLPGRRRRRGRRATRRPSAGSRRTPRVEQRDRLHDREQRRRDRGAGQREPDRRRAAATARARAGTRARAAAAPANENHTYVRDARAVEHGERDDDGERRARRRRRAAPGRRAGCGSAPASARPASPSAAPTSRPSTVRGIRSSWTISASREPSLPARGTTPGRAGSTASRR